MQTLTPTWNLGATATQKWYVRLLPSLNDLAFLLPVLMLFARFKGTQLLFSDGDTGWHIRTGEWIMAHRSVPATDLFSFTKTHQPWFAWEWLWDIAFAGIHSFAGLSGVAFGNTVILGLFSLLLYRLALRVSGNNLISMAVTALTAGVSSIHWLARPHLVTWIFTLLFLHAIESARTNRRHILYALPVLMMFWVNLHGGFVAGLMILGCYAFGEILNALVDTRFDLYSAWRHSAHYWQSLALCIAATFINPYGWQLHRHIIDYLADSELLDKIQEFQSISFHAGPAALFECMLLLAAFVVFTKLQRRDFTPVLLLGLWAHYALLSARHIPLFMLVTAPFAAELLTETVWRARHFPGLAAIAGAIHDMAVDLRAIEITPRLHLVSGAALVLIAGLLAFGRPPFAPEFNPEAFPIQVVSVVRSHPGCRLFTTDQWADYFIYRLYPSQRVFFDGRSDFYGNEFVKVNQSIFSAEHNWKSLLQQFAISLVVLKPETPLSAVLKLTPGSKILFDDGKVIVFDIAQVYQQNSGGANALKRAGCPSCILHQDPPILAGSSNRSIQLQKGKTS